MADTPIEWTQRPGTVGKTWNPTVGCTKISPGCKHCYAKTMHARLTLMGQAKYADPFEVVKPYQDHLGTPLGWRKPATIFVNSMSDLFHEDLPNEYIAAVFGVMAACPQHTFQVLTKRADRLPEWFAWEAGRNDRKRACTITARSHLHAVDPELEARTPFYDLEYGPWPLPNAWIGVSVESPKYLSRIDQLRKIPAAVRFVSIEPLLEDLGEIDLTGIHWVIIGGESGHHARIFDVGWARKIIRQCKAADVACFMKQVGANPHVYRSNPNCTAIDDDGLVRVRLKSKKGGDWSEWSDDLKVREYPVLEVPTP